MHASCTIEFGLSSMYQEPTKFQEPSDRFLRPSKTFVIPLSFAEPLQYTNSLTHVFSQLTSARDFAAAAQTSKSWGYAIQRTAFWRANAPGNLSTDSTTQRSLVGVPLQIDTPNSPSPALIGLCANDLSDTPREVVESFRIQAGVRLVLERQTQKSMLSGGYRVVCRP